MAEQFEYPSLYLTVIRQADIIERINPNELLLDTPIVVKHKAVKRLLYWSWTTRRVLVEDPNWNTTEKRNLYLSGELVCNPFERFMYLLGNACHWLHVPQYDKDTCIGRYVEDRRELRILVTNIPGFSDQIKEKIEKVVEGNLEKLDRKLTPDQTTALYHVHRDMIHEIGVILLNMRDSCDDVNNTIFPVAVPTTEVTGYPLRCDAKRGIYYLTDDDLERLQMLYPYSMQYQNVLDVIDRFKGEMAADFGVHMTGNLRYLSTLFRETALFTMGMKPVYVPPKT